MRLFIAILVCLLFCPTYCYAQVSDQDAVLAIIGEAENQGYEGMLAVAEAIRNRGHLRQVYGLRNPRVLQKRYSKQIHNMAKLAWRNSQHTNTVGNADVWGTDADVRVFETQMWFRQYRLVTQINDHYFFEEVK